MISAIMFFPGSTLKIISSSMPDTYNISYSELQNQGSPLNPILLFTNLEITKNGSNLFGAKKIKIGLPLSLNLIFSQYLKLIYCHN